MGWRNIGSIEQYYNDKYHEARKEIGELSENAILRMNADKTATSYYERFTLPLLVKDTKRSVSTKKIIVIDVENDRELHLWRGERRSPPACKL